LHINCVMPDEFEAWRTPHATLRNLEAPVFAEDEIGNRKSLGVLRITQHAKFEVLYLNYLINFLGHVADL